MGYTYEKDLVKEGDYEATIEDIVIRTVGTGRNKLTITFRIRNDVQQSYGNKVLFKDIWESKEETGVFNRKQINQLLGTQNIKDGQSFETINDVIEFLKGATLIIHVSKEFDDYRGEDENVITYYKKTKIVPQVVGGEDDKVVLPDIDVPITPFGEKPAETPAKPDEPVEEVEPAKEGVVIGDDDLPF